MGFTSEAERLNEVRGPDSAEAFQPRSVLCPMGICRPSGAIFLSGFPVDFVNTESSYLPESPFAVVIVDGMVPECSGKISMIPEESHRHVALPHPSIIPAIVSCRKQIVKLSLSSLFLPSFSPWFQPVLSGFQWTSDV